MGERLTLDDRFLIEAGFEYLTDEQAQLALEAVYEVLELRVGTVLVRNLSDSQLRRFEELVDADDEVASMEWLEANRSNYKEVVAEEYETVLRRIRAARAVRADEIAALAYEGRKDV